jgi:hypothetical protein
LTGIEFVLLLADEVDRENFFAVRQLMVAKRRVGSRVDGQFDEISSSHGPAPDRRLDLTTLPIGCCIVRHSKKG